MAQDIHNSLIMLSMIKQLPIREDEKHSMISQSLSPMRYITLLTEMEAGLSQRVLLVLMARCPEVIDVWHEAKKAICREEFRRGQKDDNQEIESLEDAELCLHKIMGMKS
jgi:hypothetical protein